MLEREGNDAGGSRVDSIAIIIRKMLSNIIIQFQKNCRKWVITESMFAAYWCNWFNRKHYIWCTCLHLTGVKQSNRTNLTVIKDGGGYGRGFSWL